MPRRWRKASSTRSLSWPRTLPRSAPCARSGRAGARGSPPDDARPPDPPLPAGMLEISRDTNPVGGQADRPIPFGVVGRARQRQRDRLEHRAQGAADHPVTPEAARRDPPVGDQHRHPGAPQGIEQHRPEFGFEEDKQRRAFPADHPRRDPPPVERQQQAAHARFAVRQRLRGDPPAARRECRDEDAGLRALPEQLADERRCRPHFTHRRRVYPDRLGKIATTGGKPPIAGHAPKRSANPRRSPGARVREDRRRRRRPRRGPDRWSAAYLFIIPVWCRNRSMDIIDTPGSRVTIAGVSRRCVVFRGRLRRESR